MAGIIPTIAFRNVLLPAPFGPTIVTISPSPTLAEASLTMGAPP
jgi:hypothetical protein